MDYTNYKPPLGNMWMKLHLSSRMLILRAVFGSLIRYRTRAFDRRSWLVHIFSFCWALARSVLSVPCEGEVATNIVGVTTNDGDIMGWARWMSQVPTGIFGHHLLICVLMFFSVLHSWVMFKKWTIYQPPIYIYMTNKYDIECVRTCLSCTNS